MRQRWSKKLGKMVPVKPRPRRPGPLPMAMTRQDERNLKHLKAIQHEPAPSGFPQNLVPRRGASPDREAYPAGHVHQYAKSESQVCGLARKLVKQMEVNGPGGALRQSTAGNTALPRDPSE